MARQFREQLEHEVNLDELNRMTDIHAKSPPTTPTYPAPTELHDEPAPPARTETDSATETVPAETPPTEDTGPIPAAYVYSPEAEAQSMAAVPEVIIPSPDDLSHQDSGATVYNDPPETVSLPAQDQDTPHERVV
jgi:hypothetical protein